MGLPSVEPVNCCEGCVYDKQARQPFSSGRSLRAQQRLHLVHADVCGIMQSESHGGSNYFLLFVDDYTRMS